MTSNLPATIHVAGPPQFGGLYQTCTRCGHVLQDYTGGMPMVAVTEEATDVSLPVWPEGERIAVRGNGTWVIGPAGRELDHTERECRPTS